jgi:hypothetical protein
LMTTLLLVALGISTPVRATLARGQPGAPKAEGGTAKVERVTFCSHDLGISLDRPADWTVGEQPSGVKFTSPQGVAIQLLLVATGESAVAGEAGSDALASDRRLPNTRCSSTTNAHGVEIRTCFDTISRSYAGDFTLSSDGSARRFSLWMARRLDRQAFEAMLASVRPAP